MIIYGHGSLRNSTSCFLPFAEKISPLFWFFELFKPITTQWKESFYYSVPISRQDWLSVPILYSKGSCKSKILHGSLLSVSLSFFIVWWPNPPLWLFVFFWAGLCIVLNICLKASDCFPSWLFDLGSFSMYLFTICTIFLPGLLFRFILLIRTGFSFPAGSLHNFYSFPATTKKGMLASS